MLLFRHGRYRRFGFILLLFLEAALAGCSAQRWASVAEIYADLPRPSRYGDAGAVIALDEGRLTVLERGGDSRFEHHRIIAVHDARGRPYAEVTIPYGGDTRVTGIRGRSIAPDGSVSLLEPSDIYDITLFPDYIFFSDARAKRFIVPGVEAGSVIEYEYVVERRSPFPFDWWIQGMVPVARSVFTLTVPLGWLYDYRVRNLDLSAAREVPAGRNVEVFRWEVEDVPPIDPEPLMPPLGEVGAHISFSIADVLGYEITKSWDNLAAWMDDLMGDRAEPDAAVEARALDLTEGLLDEREEVRRLYEWVRDNIEYVAVEIGIGGIQPRPAPLVLEHRYGDCKDMAVLLLAMLKAIGIEGSIVLVRTTDVGRFDESMPSLQFNHAIVLARPSSGEVWLDPTCSACAYAELPHVDLGAGALVIEEGRGEIRRLPTGSHRDNRTVTDLEGTLEEDGTLFCRGSVEMRGQPAIEARDDLRRLTLEGRERWLEQYLSYRCPGAVLDEGEIRSLEETEEPLVLSLRFHVPRYVQESGEAFFFAPDVLAQPAAAHLVATPERRYPVWLAYPETVSDRVVLRLPPRFDVDVSPEVISRSEPFAEFTCGVTERGDEVIFTRRIAFLEERVSRDDHVRLRVWLEELARANRRIVVVRRTR